MPKKTTNPFVVKKSDDWQSGCGRQLEMTDRDRDQFLVELDRPPKPLPELERAARLHNLATGGLDAETAAWLAGMSEEERCLAEAEAHRYEALSEDDKDAIWSEDEELIETDSEGDEIELPAR
jgi:Protein of unknown function (DUF1778)